MDTKFHIKWNFAISFVFLVLLKAIKGHYDIPFNPCPDIFQYEFNNYDCYGVINNQNFNEYPLSITIKLVINHQAHYNGSLEPLNGRRKHGHRKHHHGRNHNSHIPSAHKVNFPFFGNSLPEVEEIRINDNIVCKGEPERKTPFSVIQLEHNYGTPNNKRFVNCEKSTTTTPELNSEVTNLSSSISSPEITPIASGISTASVSVSLPSEEPKVTEIMKSSASQTESESPTVQIPSQNTVMSKIPSVATPTTSVSLSSPSEEPVISEVVQSSTSQPDSESPVVRSPSNSNTDMLTIPSTETTELRLASNSTISCGELSVNTPIVDGTKTEPHSWPWLASIFLRSGLIIKFLKFNCGGSIISPKFVLTVAHCFRLYGEDFEPDDVHVAIGAHNLFSYEKEGAKLIPSEEIFMHPDFNFDSKNFDADIAIISLLEPVTFSDNIRPICLWPDSSDVENIVGREGAIVTYSKDESNLINVEPRILQTTILPQSTCLNQSASINSTRIFCSEKLTEQSYCGGNAGTGLMIQNDNKWYLRGLISAITTGEYSITCNPHKKVIYSDVAKFKDWINSYLLKSETGM